LTNKGGGVGTSWSPFSYETKHQTILVPICLWSLCIWTSMYKSKRLAMVLFLPMVDIAPDLCLYRLNKMNNCEMGIKFGAGGLTDWLFSLYITFMHQLLRLCTMHIIFSKIHKTKHFLNYNIFNFQQ
jgi:hypothetical protein